MRVKIKPAHQIQRINLLQNQLNEIREVNFQLLIKRPREKSWCCAEVVKHMFVGHSAYSTKIDQALSNLKISNEDFEVLSASAVPSFLIKRFPPVEGKIRFKMKTSKQFKPMLNLEALTQKDVNEILDEMNSSLTQLMEWVEDTRKKDVRSIRFNSAIGPLIKFNASEACEFILCHNERHFQQVANTLTTLKSRRNGL
ncbi:MAG: hypothetical protein COA38_12095 [Fluviicola sp.]|nr:MAG: hypothetical protein COA38_12095 [Fluviicola sp.]